MEQISSRPYLCKVYGTTDSDGPTFENVHGPDCCGLTYACFFTHDACSPAVLFSYWGQCSLPDYTKKLIQCNSYKGFLSKSAKVIRFRGILLSEISMIKQ
jgi:hypothetical protein